MESSKHSKPWRARSQSHAGDFHLISLPALVRMKLSAWCDKDRMHLRDLAGVGLLDLVPASDLPPLLAERLELILAHPED